MTEGAVTYDGEEFLPVPGMQGFYVSRSLRVLRDQLAMRKRLKASQGRFIEKKADAGRGFSIRFREPGKKALKTASVRRMLYAAQTGISMLDLERMPGLRLECTLLPDGTAAIRRSGSGMEKAHAALRRMKEARNPAEELEKLRQKLRMYEQLFEQGDPGLFNEQITRLRDVLLPAYLQKRFGAGRQAARETAAAAAEAVIRRVTGGKLDINLEAYAIAVARGMHLAERARRGRQRPIDEQSFRDLSQPDDRPFSYGEAGEEGQEEAY